jgi:aldose 1-epimerase
MPQGRPLEVIWSEPGFAAGTQRASGSGIPILFPFPGRITGDVFQWQGKRYQLAPGDGRGNAIHGFVHTRAWRVLEQSTNKVVGQFQASVDDASLLECWPSDFRITATYQLNGNALSATYAVENPDTRPLPCGLGTHPYFCVPLDGGSADECVVKLPVSKRWELADMLPTGRLLPLDDPASFHAGLRLAEIQFDDVFSGLEFAGELCTARIDDPGSQRAMVLTFDRTFRECVVYTPGHRKAVCIEPYTSAPDAFRLSEQGIDAGQRVLSPGESWTANVTIEIQ